MSDLRLRALSALATGIERRVNHRAFESAAAMATAFADILTAPPLYAAPPPPGDGAAPDPMPEPPGMDGSLSE